MKSKLAIESFNEISMQEQQELNGGVMPILLALALIAIGEVIHDWDNFKNGLTGQPESN